MRGLQFRRESKLNREPQRALLAGREVERERGNQKIIVGWVKIMKVNYKAIIMPLGVAKTWHLTNG